MNLNLSERDKKLLLILAIVIIICIPYFFVIQPLLDKGQQLRDDIEKLRNQKSNLFEMAANADVYKADTEKLAVQKEEILAGFPSDLPQEGSILFIDQTEKTIPLKLYQVTFGEDAAAQIVSGSEQEQINTLEEQAGEEVDAAVIEDNSQGTLIGGGLMGISNETTFTFEAGYQEFKNLLKYVKNYHSRMVITNLTATYAGEAETVTGSFSLKQYAVKGMDRPPVNVEEPPLMQGTTNVFRQAAGTGTSGSGDTETADFFLMLSQPDADVAAKIIGRSNDASEESYLNSDDNSEQEVSITFEGNDGQYKAYYKIGKKSYSEEGTAFSKNGRINFEILSSPRVGTDDKVSAKVSIVNNTDITVGVSIKDDDTENPRVTVMGKTGVIVME